MKERPIVEEISKKREKEKGREKRRTRHICIYKGRRTGRENLIGREIERMRKSYSHIGKRNRNSEKYTKRQQNNHGGKQQTFREIKTSIGTEDEEKRIKKY